MLSLRSIDTKESELILQQAVDMLDALTASEAEHRQNHHQAMLDLDEERIRTSQIMLEYVTKIEMLSAEATELRQKVENLRAENVFLAGYIRNHLDEPQVPGKTVAKAAERR